MRDTPSHCSDHLCLILKESIHNCRWYRTDTACGTDGRTDGRTDRRTDGQTDGRTEWNQYTPPTTSLCGGYNDRIDNVQALGQVMTWYRASADDDVIKWKHFPRYWSFVRGIHRSPVNSPHKGQWRGALMFFLWSASEQTVEQTIETPVIWDAIALIMTSLLCISRTTADTIQVYLRHQASLRS